MESSLHILMNEKQESTLQCLFFRKQVERHISWPIMRHHSLKGNGYVSG